MYQIPKLNRFHKLVHGFSTKEEGNMASLYGGITVDKKVVLKNQRKFLEKLNIEPEKCIKLWLQNKDDVVVVDDDYILKNLSENTTPKADALITNKKGTYLFMVVADCAPVMIYDPNKEALALVHAGWKGADLEIVRKVIGKLNELYNSSASDIITAIGPSARKDSYIKNNPSQINDHKWKDHIHLIDRDMYKIDFVGLIKEQLIKEGVKSKNIIDCGIDTVKDERFYSHFRESGSAKYEQGRFACVVGLE